MLPPWTELTKMVAQTINKLLHLFSYYLRIVAYSAAVLLVRVLNDPFTDIE